MTYPQCRYDESFPALAAVVLEESWVLGVERADTGLAFDLEAMLTPEHSHYQPPRPGEWACWRRARLAVRSDQPITFVSSGRSATVDLDGTADYGNIDVLQIIAREPDGRLIWKLEGEWGQASVSDPGIDLQMRE